VLFYVTLAETKPAENNGAAEEPKPVEEEAKAEGSDEKAATGNTEHIISMNGQL